MHFSCQAHCQFSFFIHSQFIFEKKMEQKEMKNDVKMSEKWTKNANVNDTGPIASH